MSSQTRSYKLLTLTLLACCLLSGARVGARDHIVGVYFQPFADARTATLRELAKAKTSVHVAQYNIRDQAYVDALLALKASGVDVQVIIDAKNSEKPWNVLDDAMIAAGLPVHKKAHSSRNYGIMHHKFTIIDGHTVLTGSFNWNNTARLSNNENMVIVQSPTLAADYEEEFQELLGRKPEKRGTRSHASNQAFQVLFSPEDRPRNELAKLIDNAQSSIHVAMFTFKDSSLSSALARASQRGVRVELVTENKQASRTTADERVARAGGKVIVGANTSSAFAAMHHKYMVVDESIVVTGACNWTYTAFRYSNEDVLIIRDRSFARAYLNDFADLMKRYDSSYEISDYSWTDRRAAVNFVVEQPHTQWGEHVAVIGNHPALGAWDTNKAVSLETSGSIFPRWSSYADLPPGTRVEYKYIRVEPDGSVIWEQGANRILETSSKGRNQTVIDEFRN